ncbi:MAG: aminoacyl-tRNA hydrolase [Fimbriimonadaceae bacterium]
MFFKRPKPPVQPEWIVVGLGNPGPEYAGTRHNVGFEVVERLAARHRIKLDQAQHQARLGLGTIDSVGVALVKPLTYMNRSGRAVAPLARKFDLKPDRILVIADDLDLPTGKVRIRPKGSAGGHNGHKSLIESLGTTEYPRIKIGIGRPKDETVDHVLSKFHPEERATVKEAIELAADVVESVLADGLEKAISRFPSNQSGSGPSSD